MCEKELREQVLLRLRQAQQPCPTDELIDDLEKKGGNSLDVRKAIWHLLLFNRIELTPSRKLAIFGRGV
jgi:hypothetical protein